MQLRFLINTYERPDKLLRLLKQLKPQLKGHDFKFFIQNDGSIKSYHDVVRYFVEALRNDGEFVRFPNNHGKLHYWMLVNRLFGKLKGDTFDYAFKLDDDIEVDDDFIDTMITMFEAIDNVSKVALNPFTCDKNLGAQMWTPVPAKFERHKSFEFFKVGWVDMVWMASQKMFDLLDYHIEPIDPKALIQRRGHSSGVGRQISWRICRKQHIFYQCVKAQIYHGGHESVMHHERRKHIKLITNNYDADRRTK